MQPPEREVFLWKREGGILQSSLHINDANRYHLWYPKATWKKNL